MKQTLKARLAWLLVACLCLCSTAALAQKTVTVTGTVVETSGEPIIGATVAVIGQSGLGAMTDLDGKFTIKGVHENGTLRISYVGMKTQEIPLNGRTTLTITLQENAELLDGVVVTALGIKRSEKALSYNVQQVESDQLNTVKDANFVNSLSGKVAGVSITRSSAGIGGATKVTMRGSKSIAGNNNVLYVVDGMPIGNQSLAGDGSEYGRPGSGEGISDFNSENIESITVLTGPSAAALYGAAAANGVILINTKQGKEGSLRVNFSSNTEFLRAGIMPDFQNTYGNRPGSYYSWGDKLAQPSSFDPRDFFQNGFNTINSLTLTGGTKQSRTIASVASTHSKGIIPNNEYYRYNFSGRNTADYLDNKLHIDLGADYILQGDQNMMSGGRYFNPLRSLYLFPRGEDFENVKIWERYNPDRNIYEQYWPYGTQGEDFENPYWIANKEMFYSKKHRYIFNARVQYDFADWINLAGRVRIDNTYNSIWTKLHATTLSLLAGDIADNPMGSFTETESRFKQTYADVILNINKTFGTDWSLSANIGSSFDDHYATGVSVGGPLKLIPNFFSTANVDPDKTGGGGQSYDRTRNIALFAAGELGWRNMVYLSLTGRADWASQLVANGKTPAIFYPSVGLSGVISEMVEMPDWWSFLKVRTSFTEVGSPISMTGITPGSITYEMQPGKVNPITIYPFPDFRPERTRSYELGINSRFFRGDLSIDATFYESHTYNQTFLQKLSGGSAYSGFYVQAGDIRNRGVELSLTGGHTWGDFDFRSTLSYTRNVNRVMQLVKGYTNPIDGTTFDIDVLENPKYMRVGDSMDDIFVRGILAKDADGKLIEEGNGYRIDRSQLLKVGRVTPDFILGWNNRFAYKGLSLSFLINAKVGGNVTSNTQSYLDGFGVSKTTADARDAGGVVVDGTTYDAEKYYTTIGNNHLMAYYLYDATQVKLQELSVGYTLPKKWLGNYLQSASLSLIGQNLLTIYRAAPFDTDLAGGVGTYSAGGDNFMPPSMRSIGLSIKLGI